MDKHPTYIRGYNGSLEDFAKYIANSDTNYTRDFVKKLGDEISQQAKGDFERKRKKLAKSLVHIANNLYIASNNLDSIQRYLKKRNKNISTEQKIDIPRDSLENLAKSVGSMRYDSTRDFLDYLWIEMTKKAGGEYETNEKILAKKFYKVANRLNNTKRKMNLVWRVCEPYMKE